MREGQEHQPIIFPDGQFTYRALNSLIQGSAADFLKKAMYESWEAGIYDVLVPHITLHDELDNSVPHTKEGTEAAIELKHIMQNVYKLRIPIIVDAEKGDNWGTTSEEQFGQQLHFH